MIWVVGSLSANCERTKEFRFWEENGRKAETSKGIARRAPPGVEPATSFYTGKLARSRHSKD